MTDALDQFSITINWKRSRSSFPGLIFEVFVIGSLLKGIRFRYKPELC